MEQENEGLKPSSGKAKNKEKNNPNEDSGLIPRNKDKDNNEASEEGGETGQKRWEYLYSQSKIQKMKVDSVRQQKFKEKEQEFDVKYEKLKKEFEEKMKKLLVLLLSLLMVLSLAACGKKEKSEFDPIAEFGSDTLYVFNWGEYIGEDTIEEFENRYNVTVHYKMFDSNEEMYTSLVGGDTYDIIVPSDYMIERLIKEDYLMPIDRSKITNFKYLFSVIEVYCYI